MNILERLKGVVANPSELASLGHSSIFGFVSTYLTGIEQLMTILMMFLPPLIGSWIKWRNAKDAANLARIDREHQIALNKIEIERKNLELKEQLLKFEQSNVNLNSSKSASNEEQS